LFAKENGVRAASRHFGYSLGAISNWVKVLRTYGLHPIETKSSRPKHHPKELSRELADRIAAKRLELNRSAEVVHVALKEEGVIVSLSSVKRTLARRKLLNKRSPWKRLHLSPPRPPAAQPGALVQLDTIHLPGPEGLVYVFTAIDVYSRFAFAWATTKANTRTALTFLRKLKATTPFEIEMLQSDNGPEFSTFFSERARIEHRHSRVRRPNDNAHLERFNRTLQEELLRYVSVDARAINKVLPEYLSFYNNKRHHFGIALKTPLFMLERSQAID